MDLVLTERNTPKSREAGAGRHLFSLQCPGILIASVFLSAHLLSQALFTQRHRPASFLFRPLLFLSSIFSTLFLRRPRSNRAPAKADCFSHCTFTRLLPQDRSYGGFHDLIAWLMLPVLPRILHIIFLTCETRGSEKSRHFK